MSVEAERNFVEHMKWDEVARRLEAGAAAILPIGAGAKQHGLHLPLDTDRIQAEYQVAPGRLTRSDKTSPNYSRSGSFGDPTLAARAKGEALLAAMLDDLVEQATSFLAHSSGIAGRTRGAAS